MDYELFSQNVKEAEILEAKGNSDYNRPLYFGDSISSVDAFVLYSNKLSAIFACRVLSDA